MSKKRLCEAADIKTGKLDANAAEAGGKYPFFTCGEKPESISYYAYDLDAILLAGNNAQGNFHIQRYTGKFNAYQRTYIITAKEGYDIDYLKYSIEIALSHLKKVAQGSQTKFLTIELLNNFEVDDIPLDEQRKLIAGLKSIDKKIEINNAVSENLQQAINSLYEYWFYQFCFPNDAGKPYREAGGELVWNEIVKRKIPCGWKVQNLYDNDLFSVISSGVQPFEKKTYYATADINGTTLTDGSLIEFATRESRANMQPRLFSVWFAKMKNSIKHLFLNREMLQFIENSILSTGFYGFQCSELSFEYISALISAPQFETLKDRLSHGATQQGVGDDDLRNMALVVPDDETLEKFHNATKGFFSQWSKNIIETKSLAAIRALLLPMLMNGQAVIA